MPKAPTNAQASPARLDVTKTHKLFIAGAFPRSESGRSAPLIDPAGRVIAHFARASRKDLRDAVEAARKAQPAWAAATASNRGLVLYRLAEMMESRRHELADAVAAINPRPATRTSTRPATRQAARAAATAPMDEVLASIDRVVCFAGWADKYQQVLGCNNPVAGPYYTFTIPEPTGVVAVFAPDRPSLLGLISLMLPPLCAGNAAVAVASVTNPLPASVLAECCATSDLPAGVVNLLLGERDELIPVAAAHRDLDAIHAAGLPAEALAQLRAGAAENVKRIKVHDPAPAWHDPTCHSPWWIEPFVEMKTVWHPSGC